MMIEPIVNSGLINHWQNVLQWRDV
jgi:hypothetical protein